MVLTAIVMSCHCTVLCIMGCIDRWIFSTLISECSGNVWITWAFAFVRGYARFAVVVVGVVDGQMMTMVRMVRTGMRRMGG